MEYPLTTIPIGTTNTNRKINTPITKNERKKIEIAIKRARREIGFELGNSITIDVLNNLQSWLLKRFKYTGDHRNFKISDYHNPLSFEWLMLDNVLFDDCDGFGMATLKAYNIILKIPKHKIFRVSCLTEEPNPEGHYVAWVKADDGIIYQMENRVLYARTLRYMRDVVGYTYWDYSSMEAKYMKDDIWMKAEGMVERTIRATPKGLSADLLALVREGRATDAVSEDGRKALKLSTIKYGAVSMLDSVKYLNVSKTLMTSLTQGITSLGILGDAILNNRGSIGIVIGLLVLAFSAVQWYNRGVTTKSLKSKRSYDE